MDEARTADAVEHLQAAARELIAAARVFLEAAEEVVEDPSRFRDAADAAGGLLGDVVADLRRAAPGGRVDGAGESGGTAERGDARRVRRIDVE
jgi:hypothetical protein